MIILGIETSCDETALSVIESGSGMDIAVLADKTLSQIELHKHYGGVFPNLAKREHIKNLPLMLAPLLKEAGLSEEKPKLDAIAVTVGPGLEACLWTGITFAEALAKKWNVSVIPVNHMEGHIFSALLCRRESLKLKVESLKKEETISYQLKAISYPSLSLLISGGHTELVLIKNQFDYEVIGQTRDDAVGEAFDKVARLLGLPYPGGPQISALAEEARVGNSSFGKGGGESASRRILNPSPQKTGVLPLGKGELRIELPRPMIHSGDFDFSFSGIKTSVLYLLKKLPKLTDEIRKEIALEFENAVTEVLIAKTKKALEHYGAEALLLGGGVIANTYIRREFEKLAAEQNVPLHVPEKNLTTDNALMIAVAGLMHYSPRKSGDVRPLQAKGNLRLG